MFNQHDVYSNKENATFEQRVIAFVIDTLFCTMFGKLIGSFVSFAIPGITLIYFVTTQSFYGYTLGKYLVGLRVISINGQSSLLRMFFRESIFKWISGLFLCFGYLAVIFKDDRKAWHDKLSNTRVITLKPQNVSGFSQMARGMASLVLVTFITLGILGYQLFYTPLVIERLAESYASKGLEITGISGNYFSGFKVDKISFENTELIYSFNNVFLQINKDLSFLDKLLLRKININQIVVSKGHVEILNLDDLNSKDLIDSFRKNKSENKKRASFGKSNHIKKRKNEFNKPFRIDSLEVANITFKKGNSNFHLKRLSVANFANEPNERISFKHIYLGSSAGKVYLKNYSHDEKSNASQIQFSGSIDKNNPFISGIRRNLTFSGSQSSNTSFKELKISLFNKSINVVKESTGTEMKIKNFSPKTYFKDHFPLSKISLTITESGVWGHYHLRNKKITVPKQNFIEIMLSGLTGYSINGYQTKISPLDLISNKPWLKVGKKGDVELGLTQDHLSNLYTEKSYQNLSEKSKLLVRKDYSSLSKMPFQKILKQFGGNNLGQLIQSSLKPSPKFHPSKNKMDQHSKTINLKSLKNIYRKPAQEN